MADTRKQRSLWRKAPLRFVHSLPIGITLLFAVAAVSVAGTLINPLSRAQEVVYYTWWFQLLLVALAVNLSATTIRSWIDRIGPALRARPMRSRESYDSQEPRREMAFSGDVEAVGEAFRRRGFVVATDGDSGVARKGRIGYLGAPIAHLGVVIVLLSGFASAWLAREGALVLHEGQSSDVMFERPAMDEFVEMGFTLVCDDFETGVFPRTGIPSKFISTVSVGNAGESLAEQRDEGLIAQPVEVNRSLKVNGWTLHQTSYEAVQGSQRFVIEVASGDDEPHRLEISPNQTRPLPFDKFARLSVGAVYPYAWSITRDGVEEASGNLLSGSSALQLLVRQFEPDFMMGPDGKSSRSQEPNNPAAHIMVLDGESVAHAQWSFSRPDLKNAMSREPGAFDLDLVEVSGSAPHWRLTIDVTRTKDGANLGRHTVGVGERLTLVGSSSAPAAQKGTWKVDFVENTTLYRTTLTLARNPMIMVVYLGCSLMVAGLLLAFGALRRDVWFWVDGENGRLFVAARYRLARTTFDWSAAKALNSLDV
jgi:cytochrome c biogenesis protein ResB